MANNWSSNRGLAGYLPRLFQIPLPRIKPFSEMGVSGTPIYAGYVLTPERSSKLIGQEKFRTYSDIIANTSIVAAGIRYFLNIIAKPEWSCEPADDSGEAAKYADFVDEVFDDLHTPWSRVVRRAGMYRFHGFSMQEWTASKRDDGRIGFHDIESRPQWTIWRWEVDERGTVIGAWQRDPLTGRELGLPRGKLLYLVDDTVTDAPDGLGLLRHCVKPAEKLEDYLNQEGFGFLRDLRGIPVGRAPMEEMKKAVDAGNMTKEQMDQAIQQMQSFVSLQKKDKNTALVIDSTTFLNQMDSGTTYSNEKKWGVDLITGAAPGLPDVGKAITRLQEEIARILGIEHLMLGASSAGSFALAKEKASNLYLMANSVLRDIRLQTQHDLIKPLWSLNGFPEEFEPELKTEDVQPKDVEQLARVLRDMATAGATLAPDDEIQNFMRDLMGAPQVDLEKLAQEAQDAQDQQNQIMMAQAKQPKVAGGSKGGSPTLQEDRQDAADAKRAAGPTAKRLNGGGDPFEYQSPPLRDVRTVNGKIVKMGEAHDGNSGEGKDSKGFPLPSTTGKKAMYQIPYEKDPGYMTASVLLRQNGSYYCCDARGKNAFVKQTAPEMRDALKGVRAKHVGWE